jgi:Ca2+/Na+ antiporter
VLTPHDVAKCERWFDDNGLPYFVESGHEAIQRALRPRVVGLWAVVALLPAAVVLALGLALGRAVVGTVALALLVAGLVVLARAVRVFRVALISRWALRHAWADRSLLRPLATRALPFLLLFITFLFINTEVWQVASSLSRPLLWACVGVFALLAIAFLAPSFASEIERVGSEVEGERLAQTCVDTPVASAAREILAEPHLAQDVAGIRLPTLQRRNLMLMLFVAQAVQMLSLAMVVFAFFVVFGSIAIRPDVIETWVGAPPTYTGPLHLVSDELFSVAVFLSGFAGLYFTVQAVIDQNYRAAFFTRIEDDLQRAIGVRKVYVALRSHLAQAGSTR